MLPRTTKGRVTTNLKSINNQKCQKIKLHGTLTTMELKKQSNRTTRLVRLQRKRNCGEQQTVRGWAGCNEAVGCVGGADLNGN